MVILEDRSELEVGQKEAKKRGCAVYTTPEMLYISEATSDGHELEIIDELKQQFSAFLQVPKDVLKQYRGEQMDKYGVMSEEDRCVLCDGSGTRRVAMGEIKCHRCNGTGRKAGKVQPEKEAEHLRKEQEERE